MSTKPTITELDMNLMEDILHRIETQTLREEDYATIRTVLESYVELFHVVGDKATTIARLRKLLFGSKTEKTAAVLGASSAEDAASEKSEGTSNVESASDSPASDAIDNSVENPAKNGGINAGGKKPVKNHGRIGADAYTGAEKINVPHPTLQPGDACPKCDKGTVYETNRPRVLVRLVGQPPVGAKVFYRQNLRCGTCGETFTAPTPEAAGEEKHDATVPAMIALLKYGSGMPFNREQRLQGMVGVPLPASTQWDIVHELAEHAEPVFEELIQQAAQGEVVYNDDTTAKILECMGVRREKARRLALAEAAAEVSEENSTADNSRGDRPGRPKRQRGTSDKKKERKGLYTTGVVSTRAGRRIALFFTGSNHAGENLNDVLSRRAAELNAPIQMCDALSRNLPAELETIVAHCLAHGRRKFVEVADRFPQECRQVLETLAVIYKNDAESRDQGHSPQERLEFHQAHSSPIMNELRSWLARQFEERLVERNSSLGEGIAHMLKHWDRLTLFLRVAGAPLDNNICERILKKAILHRKNALFYKTRRGARVGDLFMSLIHTCELCGVNPFDYLTALSRRAAEAAANPPAWLPWNYRDAL